MAIVEARAKAGACNDNLYAPINRSGAGFLKSLPSLAANRTY
jgi:hypothetical protein